MKDKLLAFIHIEKTAGTTISYILRSTFGIRHCGVRPIGKQKDVYQPLLPSGLIFALKVPPFGLRSFAGHSVTPLTGLDKVAPIQYFTFLRDPIKQCASYYQYLIDRHARILDFETWIQSDWPRNMQTKRIAGVEDAEMAWQIIQDNDIFVGFVERFDESLRLLKALYIPELNLSYERRNTSPRNTVANELFEKPDKMNLLMEATEEDQKLYRRVQDVLFPHYLEQFAQEMRADENSKLFSERKDSQGKQLANLAYRNLIYKVSLGITERVRPENH